MRVIEDDLKWFEHCIETNNGFAKDEARLAIKDIKDLLTEVNRLNKARLIRENYACGEWINNHCSLCGKTPSTLNRKACSERCKKRVGSLNTQSKRVRCIEDDLVFDTVHKCEQYYNILHLYRYCSTGKAHSKINKHFEYIKEN